MLGITPSVIFAYTFMDFPHDVLDFSWRDAFEEWH